MVIFPTSGRVKSCKMSPEVWLSTLGQTSVGQTSDPSLAWKNDDDDEKSHFKLNISFLGFARIFHSG